jgi:hypothetical protein
MTASWWYLCKKFYVFIISFISIFYPFHISLIQKMFIEHWIEALSVKLIQCLLKLCNSCFHRF